MLILESMKKIVLIVAATERELACTETQNPVLHNQNGDEKNDQSDCIFVYKVIGVGLTAASMNLTRFVIELKPSAIVCIGVAGLYPQFADQYPRHQLYRVEQEVAVDFGKELSSSQILEIEKIGFGVQSFDLNWPQNTLSAEFDSRLNKLTSVKSASVQLCTGSAVLAQNRVAQFDVVLENMEGYAVAQIAHFYQIPVLELRVISNLATEPSLADWDFNSACAVLQKEFQELIYASKN